MCVSNADTIIAGDGNAKGGNEEWNGDIVSGNGNASGSVSITQTYDEYCDDEFIATIVKEIKKG